MNRIFTSLLFIATFSAQQLVAQCSATAQTVSTNQTTSVCLDASTTYTVTVDGSETGLEYLLTDTLTGSVVDGPFAGTGNPIDFNTGNLDRTTTFGVLAQTPPTAGNALRFGGGQNDFSSNRNAWNFDYSQGYTLEFVFNGNTNPDTFYNSLFSLGSPTISDLEIYFQEGTSSLTIVHGRGQSSLEFNQYASPGQNADVHIAIIFDPSIQNVQDRLQVYYNGISQARTNNTQFITSMIKTQGSSWYMGDIRHNDFNNLTDVCNGIFDEVRIWDHARTGAEINANKASCVSTSQLGLAHYYKFDEGTGLIVSDVTSNNLDLDLLSSTGNIFWVPELVSCASDCQIPMANTVTIGDLDAPTLSLASSAVNLDLDATGNATVNLADLVTLAADNCSDSSALVFTADITSFTCDDLGVNPVFVTVTDESGNNITTGTVVNVRDVTAPTITLSNSTPLEFALDANTNQAILSSADLRSDVLDNCDSSPTVSLSKTTFTCSDLGMQTITISATDSEGNQSNATEDVVIVDRTLPTFTVLNPSLELDANGSYTIQQAEIVSNLADNCSDIDDIVVNFDDTPFTCTNLGTFDFSFTVVDGNGNTANGTSSITLVDRIDPVAIAQNMTVELDQNGTVTIDASQIDNGSTDNCSISSMSLDEDTFTTDDLGANTVTLTVSDQSGNTASANATVTIENTKTPQTITFPEPARVAYGAEPVLLNATASSGLDVSYSVVFGPGTIVNGNEVEINGAGDIIIEASQAGNDSFAPATGSVGLAVTKAALTASAADITITFGSNDIIGFSMSYSGFVYDDDALDLDQVPFVSSTATVTSDAGAYPIVVSGGNDDDYDFNNVDGTFTIVKADQAIDFPSVADIDLAMANQVFLSATSDAGLPIKYTLVGGGNIASITGTTVTITGIGAITVEASQDGTSNYNAADPVANTFNVTDSRKQDQTITLSSIPVVTYGETPIMLGATSSSGLPVTYTYIDGPATLLGNEVTITGSGAVNIEVSQSGNDSFNPAPIETQTITVDPALITITPDNKEIVVGEALPTFTFTYAGFVNGEDESVLDFLPSLGSPTADANVEGVYPIVVTQDAIDGNYIFTNEEGTLTIARPLGLVDQTIKIYPNPVAEYIIIETNELVDLRFYGLNGQLIKEVTDVNGRVDVSDLNQGTYLMDISNAIERTSVRINKKY